ncbi:hypothetical protein [Homoserinibacter gongjuensis]|uniref:Uncharacterized protein n=1 Tax=Homoserinibacter gongjuensis TaxID=1162968 RepID=A0ABQ6JQL7_9MICO|nr:hypothetical protein [Homoserinibacter gongjuensis]GMA90022.1 hypothetical protein GCM10025869_05510 [Homoserinibacter gongjuensis]
MHCSLGWGLELDGLVQPQGEFENAEGRLRQGCCSVRNPDVMGDAGWDVSVADGRHLAVRSKDFELAEHASVSADR